MHSILSFTWIFVKWWCVHLAILILAVLMAFGVMYFLWCLTLLVMYFAVSPSDAILASAKEHFGQALYCLAPFGVATILMSHYQSARVFLKRIYVIGSIGAALLSAAILIDVIVMHYYGHQKPPTCDLPISPNSCQDHSSFSISFPITISRPQLLNAYEAKAS